MFQAQAKMGRPAVEWAMSSAVLMTLVDAAKQVQHQLGLMVALVDIVEGIGDVLHLLEVIGDGRITLSYGMEFVAEEDGVRFLVGAEEALVSGLVVALHGEVKNRIIDGAEDPRADAAIRLVQGRVVGMPWRGPIDVRLEAELAAHRPQGGGPFGVVGVLEL
ncbi:hypothetical protein C2845_PM01G45960 [Panicum miliaceum]|uniref:Uncharacterized protein n=1 Tax=Panicum miliaceum TaxID=4540 RepID=A0A3L6TFH4_PANMI|nr:hypothetical protein C2845_PM01G45960 [Panicum miliaceum]